MKFLHSIRLKLTAWYTLILGVTLFGFGLTAYFYTKANLLSNLDYSLRNEVVWLKNFIEPQARKVKLKRQRTVPLASAKKQEKKVKRSHEVEVTQDDSTEFDQIWNQIYEHTLLSPKKQIIQIRDRNGDILYKSYSLGKEDIVFEDIPFNTTKLVTIYDAQGQPLRLAVTQNAFAKIYVAYPEAEISEVLGNLFSIFIILVPVAIILSVLGGWFLANKSLKPVDKITKTARDITAQNLDRRIVSVDVDDEIGRLISTFNDMIGRLQGSFDKIKQFSVDASHELRTPLTIMRGELELALRSKQSNDQYRRILSSTLHEILRMSSIIENLLLLAKGDVGKSTFTFEEVSLAPIIKELHEDGEVLAEKKHIHVGLEKVENLSVLGDGVRLRQLVLNLLDNAIKYTPEHGTVSLSLIRENGSAKIIVKDNGIGIPVEDQSKIFDRFYRVDKGRSREMGGSGLGLSIAQWITETHGGKVTVQSEINRGSIFTVLLPILHH
ncbi:MAG TPA: ATP-binding protein [Bacteroidota bacterium]|nr:ATP-binding protein [Bacteroidota bacterium]